MKLNVPDRQRLLVIIVGVGLALLILDRVLFTPLTNMWKAHAVEITKLQKAVDNGRNTIARAAQTERVWAEMQANALPKDPAQAEQDVISAFDRWGRANNIELSSIRPQWKRGGTDRYSLLECRVDATGTLPTLSRFIYELEAFPARVAGRFGGTYLPRRLRPETHARPDRQRPSPHPPGAQQTTMIVRLVPSPRARRRPRPGDRRGPTGPRRGAGRRARRESRPAVPTTRPVPSPRNDSSIAPSTSFDAFRLITDRNIFNPNRTGRRDRSTEEAPPRTDVISLVGTMDSDRGLRAFFDGSESAFRKALRVGDSIDKFKVTQIAPNLVDLERDGKSFRCAWVSSFAGPRAAIGTW